MNASFFVSFVNQIWQGDYNIERTQVALSKTINITAYDGNVLVGCLRILSDGYYWNNYRITCSSGISAAGDWK